MILFGPLAIVGYYFVINLAKKAAAAFFVQSKLK
jgi:hypothetical protein